jgi:hypothetical protein
MCGLWGIDIKRDCLPDLFDWRHVAKQYKQQKGPRRTEGLFTRGTSALVVHEHRKQQNNRQWNADKPQ